MTSFISRTGSLRLLGPALLLFSFPAPLVAENLHVPDPERISRGHCRAGCPQQVAWWARPSVSPQYSVGYVGGGVAFGGDLRHPDEGVFGLDYTGLLLSRRTWLGWWHGHRPHGGGGAYRTDGPRWGTHH